MGNYTTVNIPMRFATSDVRPRGPAPQLGEHTDSILKSLGLDKTQLDSLKKMNCSKLPVIKGGHRMENIVIVDCIRTGLPKPIEALLILPVLMTLWLTALTLYSSAILQ